MKITVYAIFIVGLSICLYIWERRKMIDLQDDSLFDELNSNINIKNNRIDKLRIPEKIEIYQEICYGNSRIRKNRESYLSLEISERDKLIDQRNNLMKNRRNNASVKTVFGFIKTLGLK